MSIKRIKHFASLAMSSLGTKREEYLREMKIAFFEFLLKEADHRSVQSDGACTCGKYLIGSTDDAPCPVSWHNAPSR